MRDVCKVDHCVRLSQAKGYCNSHYQADRRGDTEFKVLPPQKMCEFEGCPYPAEARGYCRTHDRQSRDKVTMTPTRAQLNQELNSEDKFIASDKGITSTSFFRSINPFYTAEPTTEPKKSWGPHEISRWDGDLAQLNDSVSAAAYRTLSTYHNKEVNMDIPKNHGALEDAWEEGMEIVMGHGFMSCFWEMDRIHPNTIHVSLGLQHSAIMFHPEALYFDAYVPKPDTVRYTTGIIDRSKVHFFHKFGNQAPEHIRS